LAQCEAVPAVGVERVGDTGRLKEKARLRDENMLVIYAALALGSGRIANVPTSCSRRRERL